MTPPSVASDVSITGGADVIVTVSLALPTVSLTFSETVASASTVTFSCLYPSNPGAATTTV